MAWHHNLGGFTIARHLFSAAAVLGLFAFLGTGAAHAQWTIYEPVDGSIYSRTAQIHCMGSGPVNGTATIKLVNQNKIPPVIEDSQGVTSNGEWSCDFQNANGYPAGQYTVELWVNGVKNQFVTITLQ